MKKAGLGVLSLGVVLAGIEIRQAFSDDSSTPYMDSIKKHWQEQGQPVPTPTPTNLEAPDPYIQSLKNKIPTDPSPGSHIDEIKAKNPGQFPANPNTNDSTNLLGTPSYSDQERAKLKPVDEEGAIEKYNEGKSELHGKREGTVTHSFGFRFGADVGRSYSGNGAPFDSIYPPEHYAPDFNLFYEWQFARKEDFASLGLTGVFGFSEYHGDGTFVFNPIGPNGLYPLDSGLLFHLINLNASAALTFRLNIFKYVHPYAMAGPSAIALLETRSDQNPGHSDLGFGYYTAGGAAILLDEVSKDASWDLYQEYKIQHYYLNIELSRLAVIGNYSGSEMGLFIGLTFEY